MASMLLQCMENKEHPALRDLIVRLTPRRCSVASAAARSKQPTALVTSTSRCRRAQPQASVDPFTAAGLLLFLQLEWILDTAGVWPGVRAAGPNSLTRFCECQIASHLQRFLFIFFIFFAECYIRDTQQRLLFFYFHCRVPAQGHSAKFLFFVFKLFRTVIIT